MRKYTRIFTKLWRDPEVKDLNSEDRELYLYILSSPHSNMMGWYYLPKSYIAEDLGKGLERVSKGLNNLSERAFITVEKGSNMVLVHNFTKYNEIQNKNQAKGIIKRIEDLPSLSLYPAYLQEIKCIYGEESEFYLMFKNHYESNPSETPSKGFRNPSGEHDQDQDQDQEDKEDYENHPTPKEFKKHWESNMPDNLPFNITDKRRRKLKARRNEKRFVENWKKVIERASESEFLIENSSAGDSERSFFDGTWILKNDENYTKILEGKFDDTNSNKKGAMV